MPQLVKGGKYVFAWSVVGRNGEITIPLEARKEYNVQPKDKVIVVSGSKTSGGFSIIKQEKLKDSKLSVIMDDNPSLYSLGKGEITTYHHRLICWNEISEKGTVLFPMKTLSELHIKLEDRLLCVRGSGLGVGFIVKGPIIQVAKKHPEIPVCRLY